MFEQCTDNSFFNDLCCRLVNKLLLSRVLCKETYTLIILKWKVKTKIIRERGLFKDDLVKNLTVYNTFHNL